MQFHGPLLLTLGIALMVGSDRITIDDEAQTLCNKYKMMCKMGKICAVQSFEWPKNITIPVCIPLSFVPVRSHICQIPPDTGRCHARYIRWYYNNHAQECTHFQYGGCEGNQNNFMTKKECESTCLSTPSIRLYEGGNSDLMQPSIMQFPSQEKPNSQKYEALTSVLIPEESSDRYQIGNNRLNKMRADEAANTRKRRRLDKEKEKERRRREKRKEKKRLRKLRKQQMKRMKKNKEENEKKYVNKKTIKTETGIVKETAPVPKKDVIDLKRETNEVIEETKNIIANENKNEQKRMERRRKKRRERRKYRNERAGETHASYYNSRRTFSEFKETQKSLKSAKMFSHSRTV